MKPLKTVLVALCICLLTNIVHARDPVSTNNMHPNSVKVAAYFDHAINILNTTIKALQDAQYPEDIPSSSKLFGNYFDRFNGGGSSYDFALVSRPCHDVLELRGMLYEAARYGASGSNLNILRRFAAGETSKMLSELQAQLATVQQTKDFCVASAQYYYVAEPNREIRERNHAKGVFNKTLRAEGPFIVSVDTPSLFLDITLEFVLPHSIDKENPNSQILTTAATALINGTCNPTVQTLMVEHAVQSPAQVLAMVGFDIETKVVRIQPNQSSGIPFLFSENKSLSYPAGSQKPLGRVKGIVHCDGKDIAELLLTAGLARLDYTQDVRAEKLPKYFAAVTHAREHKRGMWGIPRKPASLNISAD